MAKRQPYSLTFARNFPRHLAFMQDKYDRLIHDTLEEQLRLEPNVPSKNRKPLRQPAPFAAQWELRFGPGNRFRVLYDIDEERRVVHVLAIARRGVIAFSSPGRKWDYENCIGRGDQDSLGRRVEIQ